MAWTFRSAMVVGLMLALSGAWFRVTGEREAVAKPQRPVSKQGMSYAERAQYRFELRRHLAYRWGGPALWSGVALLVLGGVGARLAD